MTKLKISSKTNTELEQWKEFLGKLKNPTMEVDIALIGKYVSLPDAYKSIIESFIHAGTSLECKVNLHLVSSEELNEVNIGKKLELMDGVLVAPGFGVRGLAGKLIATKYARENLIPFFGICLGMQVAVIEFAKNVLGKADASSSELEPDCKDPVIFLMEEQKGVKQMGEPCDWGHTLVR